MRSLLFISFGILLTSAVLWANGVGIIDFDNGEYLQLLESRVQVEVENQVARVTTNLEFRNNELQAENVTFGFPMRETASATALSWYQHGVWTEAEFSPVPPDSVPGGDDIYPSLAEHLGETPLYFELAEPLQSDSILIIQLSYVELLEYAYGQVQFSYPNDLSLIQSELLGLQELDFQLNSERTITGLEMLSGPGAEVQINPHEASLISQLYYWPAYEDYLVSYSLSLDELGLFGFSTWLPDSLIPDEGPQGFFMFVAEPEPDSLTLVMDKVFTLMIDRSGSMSGEKIIQARDASSFIVQHLNEGDYFNLVSFNSTINSFQQEHVPYNSSTEEDALTYISSLNAGGSTNISGAFEVAIPQFAVANDSTANIIVFFTDGRPTSGETGTEGILQIIEDLQNSNENNVHIFTFGIGGDVNHQLLSLIANENRGLATFLEDAELEDKITEFYLTIRNPVLLETSLTITPSVSFEVFPNPLPNLYIGHQMLVAGRYSEAVPVQINLTGTTFGQPVSYNYPIALADSMVTQYQFLTKVWAKLKIEDLLVGYYALDPDSPEALELMEEIISLSLMWGVMTPFTGFTEPELVNEFETEEQLPATFQLLGNYPNPFNPVTTIQFTVNEPLQQLVEIRIYNLLGELVRTLSIEINGTGLYEVVWDGTLFSNEPAPSGMYIYVVDFGDVLLAARMTLLK
jgi:Ca-activated chloride channel homolog